MKRRLLVARALMTKPKLAVLDEPASGLDVLHAYHVRQIIKQYVKEHGVTVLLSSHNMLEVEYLCNRVALVNKGKIVVEGEPQELKSQIQQRELRGSFRKGGWLCLKASATILVKELKELMRDPKILIGMIVLPLIMFPVLGVVFGYAAANRHRTSPKSHPASREQ